MEAVEQLINGATPDNDKWVLENKDKESLMKDFKEGSLNLFNDKLVVFLFACSLLKHGGLPENKKDYIDEGKKLRDKLNKVWGMSPSVFFWGWGVILFSGLFYITHNLMSNVSNISQGFSRNELIFTSLFMSCLTFLVLVFGAITIFNDLSIFLLRVIGYHKFEYSSGDVKNYKMFNELGIDLNRAHYKQSQQIDNYLMWLDLLTTKMNGFDNKGGLDLKKLKDVEVKISWTRDLKKSYENIPWYAFVRKNETGADLSEYLNDLNNRFCEMLYGCISSPGDIYHDVMAETMTEMRKSKVIAISDEYEKYRNRVLESNNALVEILSKGEN